MRKIHLKVTTNVKRRCKIYNKNIYFDMYKNIILYKTTKEIYDQL